MTATAPSSVVDLAASATAAQAREWFDLTGARAAVVFDGDRVVGVVTAAAVQGAPEARIADLMEFEVVRVDPGADQHETMREYNRAGWDSLRRRRPAQTRREPHLFDPPLHACPACGSGQLHAVRDGAVVNFLCEGCRECWHVELGAVRRA